MRKLNIIGKNIDGFIKKYVLWGLLFSFLGISNILAADRTVNLTVAYKTVHYAPGRTRQAIAVNNQIPAPTLHFKQGDHVTINVYNHLDKGTSIHWHGIIVPWQMDGVEGITQKAISPGGVFHYRFTLYQAGTYWYHAHADVQEQEGLYGAFIIDPPQPAPYQYNQDHVVVLSDWSNTPAHQIFANLKKDGDYYSPLLPLQPSLMKFIHDYRASTPAQRKELVNDYKMMQQMRMSIYDISDVAYDAYLLNGKNSTYPWTSLVKVGDVVRLRFIGAAGSTIYRVKIPDTTMKIVHVQGNDVKPFTVDDFSIAPGETVDVLVNIEKNKPYIIYAESIDTLGIALGALITEPSQKVNYQSVPPFPEPLPVTRDMMANMMMSGMDHDSMNMASHEHPTDAMKMNSNTMPSMHGSMSMESMGKMSATHSSDSTMPNNMKMSSSMKMDNSMAMNPGTPGMDSMSSATPSASMKNRSVDSNHSLMSDNMKMSNGMKMDSSMPMHSSTHGVDSMSSAPPSTSMENMPVASHHSTMPDNMKMSGGMKMNNSMPMNPGTPGMNSTSSATPSASMENRSVAPKHSTMSDNMKMTDNMKMDHSMSMNHGMDMNMPTEPSRVGDTIAAPNSSHATTSGTKYQNLIAAVKTNDPDKPVKGIINMELFGYMGQFIWFINGLPEYKAKPIVIEPGKRYRIIFTNNSMMRHPMHIHGHWFILRNGHGAYDPLLHTIEVPPGATAVADLDTDASGQWFFHCHHLYHMVAGMARVFQYDTIIAVANGMMKPEDTISQEPYVNRPIVRVDEQIPIDHELISHPMAHPPGFYHATFLDIGEDPFNNVQRLTFKALIGPDYNKLELYTEDAEMNQNKVENADIDIFYWHLLSQFWAIKGGANYYYRPAQTPYWQPGIGIEGLMPYFIDTNIRSYYHEGSGKFDVQLSRDTQITNNFFIRTGIRSILATKTVDAGEVGSGLNQMRYIVRPYYRLMPGFSLFFEYEHESDYGDFADFTRNNGESADQDTYTIGFSLLF